MRVEMEKGITVLFSVVYLLARAAVTPCHRVGGDVTDEQQGQGPWGGNCLVSVQDEWRQKQLELVE